MKVTVCLFFSALLLNVGLAHPALAQDEPPRQLGGAPALPPPPRPRPAASAQPGTAPAADTARRPATATAPPAYTPPAAPVYAPTAPGQLPGGSTRPSRFQVGLKNGMLYNASDVEVKNPLFGRSYLLVDGQRKLEMDQVGFYEDESGHYVRTTLPGSSRETTLRREKSGRISLYSITTAQYSSMPGMGGYGMGGYGLGGFGLGGYPYGGYRTTKTEYFSKDNGPVQNMTTRNLLLATADNAGSQQLLLNSRRYQQGILASYAVGGGLLLYGLLQSFQSNQGISPITYAAIPVLIVPIVLQGKQAGNQRQAIALYNAGR